MLKQRIWIFIVTYSAIAARHTALQSWSMVKPQVGASLNIDSTWLGAIDFTFLFCYAIGNYISGTLGDNTSLSAITSIGLGLGGFVYLTNAFLGQINFSNPWIFAILFGLQGIFQSAAWPATVAIMGNWFPKESRGKVVGFWSSNSSAGHLIGAQVAAILIYYGVCWEIIISISAIFMIIVAILFWFHGKDKPDETDATQALLPKPKTKFISKNGINFWKAWLLPGVLNYSLCYACVKTLNYAILMWLPYFLDDKYHIDSEYIGLMANIYDISSLIGAFAFGWISDRLGHRGPMLCLIMLFTLPTVWCFHGVPYDSWWMFYILTFALGSLAGTAGSLISGAVAIDLGRHKDIDTSEEALSTVAGIIDGTGGLGAAFGQIIIGYLASFDWMYAFLFMLLTGVLALLLLLPIGYRELKEANLKEEIEIKLE